MSDSITGKGRAVSLALAEPTVHVSRGWIVKLSVANLAMWLASLTPIQVVLPIQLQNIDPHHEIGALAIVSGVGAVASALATPIAGVLSDRTTHAWGFGSLRGRRHRWTLATALLAALSLVLMGYQQTVLGVGILWVLFSAFQNGEYATLSAAIPDHVPVRQRATVSGWVGMPYALGLVLGTLLAVEVLGSSVSASYNAFAILMFVLAVPFALTTRDPVLEPEHREPLSLRKLAQAFWISPRQYPDFGWAWLTRFLMSLAIAMGTLYLLYFLQDRVHYEKLFPGQTAADGLLILIVIYTVAVVVSAVIGGVISDRIGKRRGIVTVGGLTISAAAALLTFVETWDAALVAAVLFGLGFGAYLAVDQALITQVLPAATDRAKDLGIINIAIVGPSAIGAAIAGPLVTLGGYPTLYAATAVVGVLGAVLVWRIKSVA
jgi:MFS family permease